MKTAFLPCAVVVLLLGCSRTAPPQPTPVADLTTAERLQLFADLNTVPGRFQLVAASMPDYFNPYLEQQTLFKIDTITGRTWRYQVLTTTHQTHYGSNFASTSDGWRELGEWRDSTPDLIERLHLEP